MAVLTTNPTIKGDGLKFNVRSDKLERELDLSLVNLASGTNYEIGDLPKGFVPRNVAIVELVKQDVGGGSAAVLKVLLKSDSAELASRTLGTSDGITVGQVTGKNLEGAGDTICVSATNEPTNGKVKVVIAGDVMTGAFDEGSKRGEYDPKEHVRLNKMEEPEA